MPQQKSQRNLFDKLSSRPKRKPRKEVEYGANKLYLSQLNKRNLNFENRPEQKEGSHKLSKTKYSEPPRESEELKLARDIIHSYYAYLSIIIYHC